MVKGGGANQNPIKLQLKTFIVASGKLLKGGGAILNPIKVPPPPPPR